MNKYVSAVIDWKCREIFQNWLKKTENYDVMVTM